MNLVLRSFAMAAVIFVGIFFVGVLLAWMETVSPLLAVTGGVFLAVWGVCALSMKGGKR